MVLKLVLARGARYV